MDECFIPVLIGLYPNRKIEFLVGREGQRAVAELSQCPKRPIRGMTSVKCQPINLVFPISRTSKTTHQSTQFPIRGSTHLKF